MTEQKISIEFFPPKTEKGLENLHATVEALQPLISHLVPIQKRP